MAEKTVIIIQARMSSSRLPGKVMLPVLGKSLLYRMIERLKMVRHNVQLVVATSHKGEDDVIEYESLKMGVACFRGDLNNLLDRHYQAAKLFGAGIVLKIP
ncbi:MAG: acylneuraminate cytidylyltransferase, partial [Mucilaginibacter sp.]